MMPASPAARYAANYDAPACAPTMKHNDYAANYEKPTKRHTFASPSSSRPAELSLLERPGPQGAYVQLYVKRTKGGSLLSSTPTTFSLYLKDGDTLVATAVKRESSYLIYEAGEPGQRVAEQRMLGKLKGSAIKGGSFKLVDGGAVLKKLNVFDDARDDFDKGDLPERHELCSISHSTSMGRGRTILVDCGDSGGRFVTKSPTLDDSGKRKLDFNGRVTLPSVKNFQLVPHSLSPDDHYTTSSSSSSDSVTMQFGRVGKDGFNLDYQAPLSGLQAFGVAISVFNHP